MSFPTELERRLRVRRDTLLLAVVGDGAESLLTTWRALRACGPTVATATVAALSSAPPGSTVLHVLTPDQALALNLYRNALRLRVIFHVERDHLGVVRDRAPDLWDWVSHVWSLPAAPWSGAREGLRAAIGGVVVHRDEGGQASAGLGVARVLDASRPWEALLDLVRGAPVRRWVTGDAWGVARARWAEQVAGGGGSAVVDAGFDGWPGVEVAAASMTVPEALASGRPLAEALDTDLDPLRIAPPTAATAPIGPAAEVADVLAQGLRGRRGWWAAETARGLGHADVARALASSLVDDPDAETRWGARLSLACDATALAAARADGAVGAGAAFDPAADPAPLRDVFPALFLRDGRRRAREALRSGDPDGALALLDALRPVAAALPDPREAAALSGVEAEVAAVRGELDAALGHHRAELAVYEAVGDVFAAARAYGRAADVLTAQGDVDGALALRLNREIPVHVRTGDHRAKAVALGKVANVLQWRGQLDEALRLRREGLAVFERVGDQRERAVTVAKIADIQFARGEVDEALRLWRDDAGPAFAALPAAREHAMTVGKVAQVLALRGQVHEALRLHVEEELPVYERIGAARERAVAVGQITGLLAALGRVDEARRRIVDEELPVYERLGMVREQAQALGRLADLAHRDGDHEGALRIRLERELPVYEELGDVRAAALARARVGDGLLERGDVDAALAAYEAALPVLEAQGDVRAAASVLGRIAHAKARRGATDEALRLRVERQLPILERLGDVRELLVARARIAELLEARGDLAAAAEHRAWVERTAARTGLVS